MSFLHFVLHFFNLLSLFLHVLVLILQRLLVKPLQGSTGGGGEGEGGGGLGEGGGGEGEGGGGLGDGGGGDGGDGGGDRQQSE